MKTLFCLLWMLPLGACLGNNTPTAEPRDSQKDQHTQQESGNNSDPSETSAEGSSGSESSGILETEKPSETDAERNRRLEKEASDRRVKEGQEFLERKRREDERTREFNAKAFARIAEEDEQKARLRKIALEKELAEIKNEYQEKERARKEAKKKADEDFRQNLQKQQEEWKKELARIQQSDAERKAREELIAQESPKKQKLEEALSALFQTLENQVSQSISQTRGAWIPISESLQSSRMKKDADKISQTVASVSHQYEECVKKINEWVQTFILESNQLLDQEKPPMSDNYASFLQEKRSSINNFINSAVGGRKQTLLEEEKRLLSDLGAYANLVVRDQRLTDILSKAKDDEQKQKLRMENAEKVNGLSREYIDFLARLDLLQQSGLKSGSNSVGISPQFKRDIEQQFSNIKQSRATLEKLLDSSNQSLFNALEQQIEKKIKSF